MYRDCSGPGFESDLWPSAAPHPSLCHSYEFIFETKAYQSLHRLSTPTIYSFNVHLITVRMYTIKNINLSSKVYDELHNLFVSLFGHVIISSEE